MCVCVIIIDFLAKTCANTNTRFCVIVVVLVGGWCCCWRWCGGGCDGNVKDDGGCGESDVKVILRIKSIVIWHEKWGLIEL